MRARSIGSALVLLLAAAVLAAQGTSGLAPTAFTRDASACTRYASPQGSDSAGGTKRRPFRTAQRLVDALRPGQTGCLRRGTYRDPGEEFVVMFPRAGRPGAPITLRSHPGERARLVGILYVPRGSDHVTVSRLTLEGSGASNTVKINAADVVVQSNDITNAWRGLSCIILGNNDGWGAAVRPVIRGNRIHECGDPAHGNLDHGIYAANVQGGRIAGNRIWNVAAYAIQIYPNSQRLRVTRNIVDGGEPSVRGGVLVGGDDEYASSGNVIEHNVIAYARTYNVRSAWEGAVGHGNVVRANCLWGGAEGNLDLGGGMVATGNRVADPKFVSRARHDYRLAAGSRCRSLLE